MAGLLAGSGCTPESLRTRTGGPAAKDLDQATYFGLTAEGAQRVVYLLDRSGSMTDTIDYVRQEMKRSIKTLRGDQEFQVIAMSSGPALSIVPRGLRMATPVNKEKACEFLDGIIADGETDPTEAFKEALALKPDAIFFLTDGECDRSLFAHVRRWNPGGKVAIHCIQFLYKDGEALLKQLAAENHGKYKFVSEDDLKKLFDEPQEKPTGK